MTVIAEEIQAAAAEPAACPECGEPIPGRFCTRCGEKRVEARDYSLRHFLAEALNVFANLESPVPRSFFALLFRPGLLTAEYLVGRRKRYLKPLQLFVFCNVIFFFAQPLTGFNTLTTPLAVQMRGLPYSSLVRGRVREAVGRKGVTLERYAADFDETVRNQARTLVIVMVPLLALALVPLYWRRHYFVEHLVFATHFYAVFLLFLLAVHYIGFGLLLAGLRLGLLGRVNEDLFFGLVFLTASGAYLYRAQRRVYARPRLRTFFRTLALLLAVTFIINFYRFILFFTAYYSV
ncbi:MAG: DUF3667 domain-containing protein [Acidobacteriota bacterium]|nr:DUF3667 domain-containing protein [Acidobacteriota bacterium]